MYGVCVSARYGCGFFEGSATAMKSKPWSFLFDHLAEGGPDYRFAGPTLQCLCGSDMFGLIVTFDENRCVATYFLDARCMHCGAHLIAPTEGDETWA